MAVNPWLRGYKIEIRWEEQVDGSRRCIGDGIDASTGKVVCTERIRVAQDEPESIAEETVRGRVEELLERIARNRG